MNLKSILTTVRNVAIVNLIINTAGCSTPQKTNSLQPTLNITAGSQTKNFTADELMTHPLARSIQLAKEPVYQGKNLEYRAVPASALFEGLNLDPSATLLFNCLDGFSAPIDKTKLFNRDPNQPRAYIAVEPPKARWPILKKGTDITAGPFYLIWLNAEKGQVSSEEWPFQLVGFTVKPPIEVEFPHIQPDPRLPKSHPIQRGYVSFLKNCFTCHTMNGEGHSRMGPDLNIPNNPTEYLQPEYLIQQIRNPQKVKQWREGKMPGLATESLSDQDLKNLIAYLKHMAKRKYQDK